MGEKDGVNARVVKDQTVVAEAQAPALPAWSVPAVPKPSLPLPIPATSRSNEASDSKMSTKDPSTPGKREWNTSKLGLRVGVDALSAGAAAALVAPLITMIDKGIIENASGRNTLKESLKQSAKELMLRPHHFIASRPFLLIFVRLPQLPFTHPRSSELRRSV